MITASFSGMRLYRKCPRRYHFEKVVKRMPVRKSFAMRFGSVVHEGLQAYDESRNVIDAIRASALKNELTPIETTTAEMLCVGYQAQYPQHHELVGTEVRWELPLVNPRTNRSSRTFTLKGFMDKVLRIDGKLYVLERKTSGENIQPGSMYWERVALDEQVSLYWRACRDMDIRGVLYDVIGKPTIKPARATPVESRKWTKGKRCKACKGTGLDPKGILEPACPDCDGTGWKEPPRLYSNMRTADESPIDWARRLSKHIVDNTDRYYQRAAVVRMENETERTERDIWDLTQLMRRSYGEDLWPRNPNACHLYNSRCPYLDVCSGLASIDDDARFVDRHKAKEANDGNQENPR